MSTGHSTDRDYRDLLLRHLPQGMFWRSATEAGTALYQLLYGLAAELSRAHTRGLDALDERDSRTADETIDRALADCGLPRADLSTPPTTAADKRSYLHAHLTTAGGQTIARLKAAADRLGIAGPADDGGVRITGYFYRMFRAGHSRAGEPVYSADYLHTLLIEADSATSTEARGYLENTIDRFRPAHVATIYDYTS